MKNDNKKYSKIEDSIYKKLDKTVSMYQILKTVFNELSPIDPNKYKDFSNFRKDTQEKLIKILEGIGVDITKFKVETGKRLMYHIPLPVACLIKTYLQQDSSKNSFISKIINNNIDQISKKEKITFINNTINEFEKMISDIEFSKDEKEKINDIISDIQNEFYGEIIFKRQIELCTNKMKDELDKKILNCINIVTDIPITYGIIKINDSYNDIKNGEDITLNIPNSDDDELYYRILLPPTHRKYTIKYLINDLNTCIDLWNIKVKRFADIINENVENSALTQKEPDTDIVNNWKIATNELLREIKQDNHETEYSDEQYKKEMKAVKELLLEWELKKLKNNGK